MLDTDYGESARHIISKAEIELYLTKLTKKEQKIISMIMEGYTIREIKNKLKLGQKIINQTLKKYG